MMVARSSGVKTCVEQHSPVKLRDQQGPLMNFTAIGQVEFLRNSSVIFKKGVFANCWKPSFITPTLKMATEVNSTTTEVLKDGHTEAKRASDHAPPSFTYFIINSLQSNAEIYADFSKAFEFVNFRVLIAKISLHALTTCESQTGVRLPNHPGHPERKLTRFAPSALGKSKTKHQGSPTKPYWPRL